MLEEWRDHLADQRSLIREMFGRWQQAAVIALGCSGKQDKLKVVELYPGVVSLRSSDSCSHPPKAPLIRQPGVCRGTAKGAATSRR